MEVRALCFSLMIRVLFLLAARDEVCCSVKDNTVFPQIIPNRQQFFEYEPITVSCEGLMGLTGWRVMKRIRGKIQPCAATWESSTGPCRVENAIPSIDSGEYWCEIGAKKISSVHITVTAGPVVLDSPAVPVFEGDDVTLSCRNKELDSNSTAQFFKDGVSMGSSVTGSMTIYGVSSFDEGLYKCRISEGGESPQSWFTVREAPTEDPPPPPPEPQLPLLLQICISLGIFLVVLLLSAGLLQCKKRQTVVRGDIPAYSPSVMSSTPVRTVSLETRADTRNQTTRSSNKPKKKRDSRASRSSTGPAPRAGYWELKHPTDSRRDCFQP